MQPKRRREVGRGGLWGRGEDLLTQTKAVQMWQRSCERKAQPANSMCEGRKNIGHRGIKIKHSKAMQRTLNLVLVDRKGCTIHLPHPFSTLLMRSHSAIFSLTEDYF